MSCWSLINYNKRSAKKYGWHPSWFGLYLTNFDSELIKVIKQFQTEHDLTVDGKVGPMTFRRLLTFKDTEKTKGYILINGQYTNIDWDVKIDLFPNNCYKTSSIKRMPKMIVTHWDATTSAEKCKRVLQARGISTHFCIDNDGIIYQYADTKDIAWHAGSVNKYSIGIDFSNAYYLKYADYYIEKGFNKRPVCEDSVVHGVKLKPHLGYYPVQIEAYKRLLGVLTTHYNIDLATPPTAGVIKEAQSGKYNGIVCHYHVSRNKIDCAGLDLKTIISELD